MFPVSGLRITHIPTPPITRKSRAFEVAVNEFGVGDIVHQFTLETKPELLHPMP